MEHEELTQPSNNETLVHITLTYKTPSYTYGMEISLLFCSDIISASCLQRNHVNKKKKNPWVLSDAFSTFKTCAKDAFGTLQI